MLSMRPDLLPAPYQKALSQLQDNIDAFPASQAIKIIEEQLGADIQQLFSEFDEKPMGAASLGQVHAAKLRDGKPVVVKVQRPNIQKQIAEDMQDLNVVADLLSEYTDWAKNIGLKDLLKAFETALLKELDYEQEAHNLRTMGGYMQDYPLIFIPQPVDSYVRSKVLCMDHVQGQRINSLNGVVLTELDTHQLATDLCKAYLDQVLVHGFLHADPHPGNVLLTNDHRIAMLDLGMVAYISPDVRRRLTQLMIGIADGRGNDVADICIKLSTPFGNFDRARIEREVSNHLNEFQNVPKAGNRLGEMVLGLTQIALNNQIRPSPELTLLGKTLLYLDELSLLLADDFNPRPILKKHAGHLLTQEIKNQFSATEIIGEMLDIQDLVKDLPRRANQIIDNLANNEVRFKVDTVNEKRLIGTIEKIANRITAGLVVASLIIGAALLMPIQTSVTIFGYPAMAIVLFLFAAILGFVLVISILINDRNS